MTGCKTPFSGVPSARTGSPGALDSGRSQSAWSAMGGRWWRLALESPAVGWKVMGAILLVSATLNAIQVVVVDDVSTRILRLSLSALFVALAVACFHKSRPGL